LGVGRLALRALAVPRDRFEAFAVFSLYYLYYIGEQTSLKNPANDRRAEAVPKSRVSACKTRLGNRISAVVSQAFRIRPATPDDAAVIAGHRARMFRDMGLVPDELFESLRMKSLDRLSKALASGDYIGWLASLSDVPEKIIAGVGVIIRQVHPFPHRKKSGKIIIAEGRQGLIINVFTEPEWRRRGIAKLLMKEIIAWSREQSIDDLVLHASDEGRAIYEQLGFVLSKEMRLRD
jgi:GNAT superfamily N-acetyltransferase